MYVCVYIHQDIHTRTFITALLVNSQELYKLPKCPLNSPIEQTVFTQKYNENEKLQLTYQRVNFTNILKGIKPCPYEYVYISKYKISETNITWC